MKNDSIFIFGYYGWHNTGDDSMLYALLLRYEREKQGRIYRILARQKTIIPEITGRVEWIKCRVIDTIKAVLTSGKIVVGGGTHISDYGLEHKTLIILLRIFAIFVVAKILFKKIELIGNGITLSRKWSRVLIRAILLMVDKAEMRDYESYKIAVEWCRPGVAEKADDLTKLLLPFVNEKQDANILGLVVSPVYHIYEDDWGKEIQTMARITSDINDRLRENKQLRVRIIIFKGKSKDDDVEHSHYYYGLLNPKDRVEIIEHDDNPIAMIREVAKCGRIISMRYHACYYAKMLGIPLEIETPHPKCKYLAR